MGSESAKFIHDSNTFKPCRKKRDEGRVGRERGMKMRKAPEGGTSGKGNNL